MHKKTQRKKLREDFNSQDSVWRIEAVIHDGNWYDKEKWIKVAKVKEEELDKWMFENKDILIESEIGSYRVGHDEIIRWYEQEGIDIEESIIPNNFPPRLWTGKTETDVFLEAPRRRVGTISFVIERSGLLEKCVKILKGTAKVMPDKNGRYKAFGLSAVHMKNLLSKGLSKDDFVSLDIKTRAVLMQRELADLPDEWLEGAIEFYSQKFSPNALKSSLSTINIYLPDRHDVHAQTVIWVIKAMKKFNENASVPFAGYLSSVLRHWPYNLPDEYLGKELSRFQRERKRAIDLAVAQGHTDDNVPIEIVAQIMDIPLKSYIELTNEHETWLAEKNATTLTWQDSANEKKGIQIVGQGATMQGDRGKMFELSLAAVKAAVDTREWDSAYEFIGEIDKHNVNESLNDELDESYLESLKDYIRHMVKREY